MPRRVIKQPNGKLAIFSSIVDHIIYYDCNPDEAMEVIMDVDKLHPDYAREKVKRGIDDLEYYGKKHGDGRWRWDNDMFHMLCVHGTDSESDLALLADCGMTATEIERWVGLANRAIHELDTTGGTSIHARYEE